MYTFEQLREAQLRVIQPLVDSYLDFTGSDDRWDYLTNGLRLAADIMEIENTGQWSGEEKDEDLRLLDLLNLHPWSYACDGVCSEIWEWLESLCPNDPLWYEEIEDNRPNHVFKSLKEVKK